MPPDNPGSLNARAIPRAWCLLALLLCATTALAFPHTTEAALTDGLVGHWTFDGPDVTTTVTDRSGQNNHGYFNGGATSSAKVIGKLGQALSFDGSTQGVVTGAPATTATDNWTLAAWIKPSNVNNESLVIQNGKDGLFCPCTGYGFGIGDGTGSAGSQLQGVLSDNAWLDSGYTFPVANEWYHIVMLRDAGTTKFYVNGVQTANTFTTDVAAPTVATYIGNQFDTKYFPGLIDDVRIYNRALSPTEIQQLYRLGTVRITQ